MIVFHGGTEIVRQPLVAVGRKGLDFGLGFYVTDIRSQAEAWAARTADRRAKTPMLNVYELDADTVYVKFHCLKFDKYDRDWLDFVADSRYGRQPWAGFDLIEGGVADDRVVDTVEAYVAGLITADVALEKLSYYRPNNQICILSQEVADVHLHFLEAIHFKR